MRILLPPFLTLFALAACGGSESTPVEPNISVYKYVGSVQCTGGGTPLPAMESQLSDAGIHSLAVACGGDGNLYPAICGGPDGRIAIFDVPAEQSKTAVALGFAPLGQLPGATRVTCQKAFNNNGLNDVQARQYVPGRKPSARDF